MFQSLCISIALCGGLFFICSRIYNSVKKRNSGDSTFIRLCTIKSTENGHEKRSNPRIKINRPLLMFNDSITGAIPAIAGDISLCGAFLKCEAPVRIGEKIKIEFLNETRLPVLSANVIWSNSGVHQDMILNRGLGVKFTDISVCTRKVLEQIIAEHA